MARPIQDARARRATLPPGNQVMEKIRDQILEGHVEEAKKFGKQAAKEARQEGQRYADEAADLLEDVNTQYKKLKHHGQTTPTPDIDQKEVRATLDQITRDYQRIAFLESRARDLAAAEKRIKEDPVAYYDNLVHKYDAINPGPVIFDV